MKSTLSCFTKLVLSLFALTLVCHAEPSVTAFKLPNGGIRPQAMIDASGVVHIVQADSKVRGDLVYVKHHPDQNKFSKPIKVLNQAEGMAAGFNMALGKNGRVHVMIRPTPKYSKMAMGEDAFNEMFKSKARFFVLRYMLHSRLNDAGTAFEKERNFVGGTIGFEGVGALVADSDGSNVYAFWPGQTEPGPEMDRDMYMAVSTDEGANWSEPRKLDIDIEGNCRCCPIQATMDLEGNLYIIHRNSVKTSPTSWDKDTFVLKSEDQGKTWTKTMIQKWEKCGCPGAPYSLTSGPSGAVFGFQTRGVSSFARADSPQTIIEAPDSGNTRSRPMVAINQKDEVLFCWIEAQDVVWQVFGKDGKPMPETSGRLEGVAAKWSNAAVVATASNDFLLYYDDAPPVAAGAKR